MQGLYNIYQEGELTFSKNVITDAGKMAGLNALAGRRLGFVSSIGVGIGETTATSTDTQLNFLLSGGDINIAIPDYVNGKIYFKTSLPVDDQYTIYELSCFGQQFATIQNVSQTGLLISSFNSDQGWVDVLGTHNGDTTNNRVGAEAFSYSIAGSATAKGQLEFDRDLSGFTNSSEFKFAYYTNNMADLFIRFKNDDANYFEADALSVANGYHIGNVLMSSFVSTGSPDWSDIKVFEVEALATTSAGVFSLDAMRIDLPLNVENSVLSRTVLGTPLKKLPGTQMDIEYVLEPGV